MSLDSINCLVPKAQAPVIDIYILIASSFVKTDSKVKDLNSVKSLVLNLYISDSLASSNVLPCE